MIEPFYMVHSSDPYSFWVYDPTLWYCYKCVIDTWWVYAWDGEKLADVSAQYTDDYRKVGQELLQSIRNSYGTTYWEWRLLEILFLYEKAGLRAEALQEFMDISDPVHWSQDDPWRVCWLQVARASAAEDYRLGRPFRFPPVSLSDALGYPDLMLQHALEKQYIDPERYNLSACLPLLPTATATAQK